MPQPTKIPRAFASSGDKNSIPDSTGNIGFASWSEGFPAITSTPFAQGGVAPKRADFNGVFNALSAATVWQQKGGFYAYDATTDYEVGNVVEYNGELYKCLVANGPSSSVKAPSQTTYWARLYTSAGGSVTGHFIVDGYHNSISNYGMLLTGTNQNYGFILQDTTITKGSVFPASTKYISQIYFGSAMGTYNDRMAHIREAIDSNGANRLEIVAFGLQSANDTTTCAITVGVDENDVPYTSAPTPATGDNSTKIATTAFVKNNLPGGYITSNFESTTVANNAMTNLGDFTLSKVGLYIVQANASFASDSSGYRRMVISSTSTGSQADRFKNVTVPAVNGSDTSIQMLSMMNNTNANSKYYVNVLQTSGGSLSVSGGARLYYIGQV